MRYRAFISYSHADARWARWLIRRLEGYTVPSRLVGTMGDHGVIGPTLGAFFRDREELTASGDLGATIRAALAESDALVLVCSPAAARSRWVNAEIETFRAHRRGDRVLCFVVDGDPGSTDEAIGCFPAAMRTVDANGESIEPLAADARAHADGRESAFLKLVAGLLGVRYDMLAQREAQRRQKRLLAVAAASLAGMAIALGLAATAYVARNDAQRRQAQAEDILGFMLGDLREKLTSVGRLDLMRSVDDKATGYFATLDPRDLSDRALEEQARSLTGIGQVRLAEGNHAEAMAAFEEAHSRSSALQARAPQDGQRLFDLAQAEYWIGNVAFEQGRHDDAGSWLRRYRDSAIRLAAMDPSNFDWQREIAYGHHNLAVLDDSLGHYASAEEAMRRKMALNRAWVIARPDDLDLRFEAADTASWLGSFALRQGRLNDAHAAQSEAVQGFRFNHDKEPQNARWKDLLGFALILQAEIQAQLGRVDDTRRSVDASCGIARELVALDPKNHKWQHALGQCHWWNARLAEPVPDEVAAHAIRAEGIFAAALAAEPKELYTLRWLARTRNVLARIALSQRDGARARRWLARTHKVLDPAWRDKPNEALRIVLARLLVLDGEAEQLDGDAVAARAKWQKAHELLGEAATGQDLPFERLDPLVRTLHHLGRHAEARPHRDRLEAAGYIATPALPPLQTASAAIATFPGTGAPAPPPATPAPSRQ